MPALVNKYELYQQVLKLEFIREFHALVEAANGRGEFKADFTDKILALVGKMIEPAVDAGNVVLPGVPALLKKGAESLVGARNKSRHAEKVHYFLQQGFEYNPQALTVLADELSLIALKRYQWFVSQLEHDSVIRFAKAGVERMLEYLARKQLNLTLQHLLDGLLQGHSGAYMSGYFNTQLSPIDCLADRIPPSNKIKSALGFTRVTAEGIYGRSGLLTCDDGNLTLHTHAQFNKDKAKHKILGDQHEQSRFERVKEALSKEGRERWFDYGYSKAHIEYKDEPKYGYAFVSPAEVGHYYGDEKTITTKPLVELKSSLKDSLARFSYEIIPFNKTQLKNYLAARKEEPSLMLLTYLKEQLHAPEARLAYFEADERNVSDLDLANAHLDDCIFDDSIFPADLSNTTLRNSFLRHADFKLVKKADGLDLSGAHAEYLDAEGASLSHTILRSANLFGANLAKTDLTGADLLGANLVESNLQEATSPNLNLQDIQAKQVQLVAQQQRLEEKQSAQSQEIAALRKTVSELQENNHVDVAEKLDQFIQQRAARESLERYCRNEIEKLNIQAQQQEKLNQQQAEHLQSLKQDLADLQKMQVASQENSKKLLSQFEKLSTQVDVQGSQLKEVSQLLDKLISGIHHQLNQHEQQLVHHKQQLGHLSEEMQMVKRHLEEKNLEPFVPLSGSRLEQIKQELYANYQKRAVMYEFAPNQTTPMTLPITENTFIHLALVTQDQQQQQQQKERDKLLKQGNPDLKGEQKTEKAAKETEANQKMFDDKEDLHRQQLLNSWEMISQVQKPISVDDLWLDLNDGKGAPQHLFIEGSAGIGKTTLCGFVSAQWSQQKLWTERFDWVLWIPLRNLIDTSRYPRLAYDYLVKSLVLGECFRCLPNDRKAQLTPHEQESLWQQLVDQEDRVLYILDGYDEIASYENRTELAHLKAALSQLFQSKHILLTTRPQVINNKFFNVDHFRKLVTLGLSNENIPSYVEHYFKAIFSYSEEKQLVATQEKSYNINQLLEALKANKNLWSISHVPLHLSLICLAYAEGKIQLSDLIQNFSLTQLYQQIVNVLLQRYLKEKLKNSADFVTAATVEYDINTQRVTQFLEEFAFRGMNQYDLILNETLLIESLEKTKQTIEIIPALIASGFLKQVNNYGNLAYQFVHLTFQEFFAARYLARRLQQSENPSYDDWIKRFHEYKHIPLFAVMLWFTAGLLKDKPLCVQQFMQLLQASPSDEVGLYHLGLIMRCVAEAGYPKELTAHVSQNLGQLVKKCWFEIREGTISNDGNKEVKARSAQQVLHWLGRQIQLTPKIEFPALSLKAIVKDLSYESLVFKDKDWQVKKAAADLLRALSTPTPEILQTLVALLKDKYDFIREAAAFALGELKISTPEILQGLMALLKDEEWNVIQAAALALGELRVTTPEVLPDLVDLLKDERWQVREGASRALEELKASTPEILQGLLALLQDDQERVRQAAVRALTKLKAPNREILPSLVAIVKDNDGDVRQAEGSAIGELKAPNREILPSLVAMEKDNDSDVGQASSRTRVGLKIPASDILKDLMALLENEKWEAREGAARALGELKALTPEVLQGLVTLLKDESGSVRQAAARALGELKAPTPEILQGLVALFKDDSGLVRQAAAEALGELKVLTPDISKGLVALLKDSVNGFRDDRNAILRMNLFNLGILNDSDNEYANVRRAAAEALRKLNALTPEVIQELLHLLKDPFKELRYNAAKAIAELKLSTPEILNALVVLLKDRDSIVGMAAEEALIELKTPTSEILQGLLSLLKDNNPNVRRAAANVLRELKLINSELLQGLVALLRDEEDVRLAAARALGELKAPTPEILQGLVALLKDNDRDVRQAAARALGELRAPTPEILQGLVALLKDNYRNVRQAAAQALNNFSIASLLTIYFQHSCQWYQSSLQETLLTFICMRWLDNREVAKITNHEIHWLEQGQWQHLPIPSNHPHFQSYLAKTIKELIGPPLTLTFSKFSAADNLGFLSPRPSSSPRPELSAEQKSPRPK